MANAYSKEKTYNNWVPPFDLNLATTVLNSKEQKYNANLAKIDAVIETYAKVDLARAEDKQLLYDNINNVINNFQGVSKMAMTNTDTIRQVEQSFTTALTPYLTEQMVNTAKMRRFETDLATLKEKKPESYSEINANFALKNAGMEAYMSGKTDKLGSLEYTPYKNVYKEVQPQLDSFAKEYGYENYTQLIQSQNDELLYQTVKGKRLTKETVQSFLETVIGNDPTLVKQLEIDAWGTFGGLSDKDFEKFYKGESQRQANNYGAQISVVEEDMKVLDKESDKYKNLEAQLKFMQGKKTEFEGIVNSTEKLDRDKVGFSVYSGNFIKGLANTYSYDRQESVKYGNPYLEVAKDYASISKSNLDVTIAQNKELRDQQIHQMKMSGQMDSKGNLLNPNGAGLETSKILPDDKEEEGVNVFTKATEDYSSNYEKVRAQMKAEDPNFKAKTVAQQNAIISNFIDGDGTSKTVMDSDGNIVNYSQEVKNAIAEAKTAKNWLGDYQRDLNIDYMDDAKTMYEDVLNRGESTLRIDSVKGMPDFVKAIKAGTPFEELTHTQKNAITYEYIRSAMSSQGITKSTTEKRRLEIAELGYRKRLDKQGQAKYLEGLDKTYGKGSSESINPLEAVAGQVLNFGAGIGTEIWRGWGDKMTEIFSSKEQVAKRLKDQKENPNKYFNQIDELGRKSNKWIDELLTMDENIGAWSRGDVSIQGVSATEFFSNRASDRDTRYSTKDGEYAKNASTVQQVNFVKEDKTHLPYINDIRSIVESQTGKKVAGDSTIGYRFNSRTGMYDIDVMVQEKIQKKGKETFTNSFSQISVPVKPEDMTERLRQRISPTSVNYANSYYNPNKQTEEVNFRLPSSTSNKETLVKNIMDKGGNRSIKLEEDLNTLIKTPTERMSSLTPYIKNDKQRASLNELYKINFGVRYIGSSEQGYMPEVVGTLNGQEVYTKRYDFEKPSAIESPQAIMITTAHYTNLALKEREAEILRDGEK